MLRCFLVVIDRYEDSRGLEDILKNSTGHVRVSLSRTETSGLACQLRETPLTDGDVGHYDKEPGESSTLDVFDRPCDAEGLNILPSSHEFSKIYFNLDKRDCCLLFSTIDLILYLLEKRFQSFYCTPIIMMLENP